MKAALLSGLVFPGLGHMYLQRWVPGILLAGVAAFAVYLIFSITMAIALDIAQQIESGVVPPDLATITSLVSQQLRGSEEATNAATMAFLICWALGIIGSYWQGRSQDRLDVAAKQVAPARNEGDA